MSEEARDVTAPIIAELVSQTAGQMAEGMRLVREGLLDRDRAKRDEGLAMLRQANRSVSDAVSAMPETELFLKSRGLTHVGQLDKAGREELREHLGQVLAALTAKNTPA